MYKEGVVGNRRENFYNYTDNSFTRLVYVTQQIQFHFKDRSYVKLLLNIRIEPPKGSILTLENVHPKGLFCLVVGCPIEFISQIYQPDGQYWKRARSESYERLNPLQHISSLPLNIIGSDFQCSSLILFYFFFFREGEGKSTGNGRESGAYFFLYSPRVYLTLPPPVYTLTHQGNMQRAKILIYTSSSCSLTCIADVLTQGVKKR